MVEIIDQDIFLTPIEIVLHSCNCFNTMGKGIALDIKRKYPRAAIVDSMTKKGDKSKLGQFTVAIANHEQIQTVINLYTQYTYGYGKVFVQYDKFHLALENFKKWLFNMNMNNQVVGIPYNISCNNAGGDWTKILSIIKYVFDDELNVKIAICKKTLLLK